jgi:16S rRNA (adenine1518-N6/adenine1519-N6)-dimethyltransferase
MTINQDLLNRAKNYSKQKSLGQNFLVDEDKLDDIVSSANLDPNETIAVEIGPGIGFLTERILPQVKHLYSIELDSNAIYYLKLIKLNNDNFDFLRDDFLALSLEDVLLLNSYSQKMLSLRGTEADEASVFNIPDCDADVRNDEMIDDSRKLIGKQYLEEIKSGKRPKLKIVANIPYQISTKILLHLLGEMSDEDNENRKLISEINILVQKEFANRLLAKPGVKDYSAITLLIQYWAEVERCVEVPKECFRPIPKVDSSFIKIKLRDKAAVDSNNPKQLRRFIKAIFANRRKKLINGLKSAGYNSEQIDQLNLAENIRGETLGLGEINSLVNKLYG